MEKVVAVIPARNEEKFLPKTLEALIHQTYPIEKIIVVNDGSTDNTKQVAEQFDRTIVIDRPDRGYDAVGKSVIAETFNTGFQVAEQSVPDYKYLLIVGADSILPQNYVERAIQAFQENPTLVITSGVVKQEMKRVGANPSVRGTRIIRKSFWTTIGARYPVKVGWETYPLFKADMLGFEVYPLVDLEVITQRPTGKRTDYYAYGMAMRALGYHWMVAVGRSLVKKNPKTIFQMIMGYIFGKDRYEEELRKFVKNKQKRRIRRILFRF